MPFNSLVPFILIITSANALCIMRSITPYGSPVDNF